LGIEVDDAWGTGCVTVNGSFRPKAAVQYTLARGLEFEGGDSIDDYL